MNKCENAQAGFLSDINIWYILEWEAMDFVVHWRE